MVFLLKFMKNLQWILCQQHSLFSYFMKVFLSNFAFEFQVEHVVREEKTMAAYEMIELYCELIVARLAIIESQKYVSFYAINYMVVEISSLWMFMNFIGQKCL